MLDVGSGHVALEEAAGTPVAQADGFPWKRSGDEATCYLLAGAGGPGEEVWSDGMAGAGDELTSQMHPAGASPWAAL